MKISEVTVSSIKTYLRITYNDDDTIIGTMLASSKAFIKGYTGLTDAEIDTYEDLTIALYCLVSEMYDNRRYTVQHDKLNPAIATILNMHCVNLL